jgi:hypothetical protein
LGDPGELLSRLNRALRSTLEYSEVPLFVSAFYLLVFRSSHERCRIAMSFDVQKGQL